MVSACSVSQCIDICTSIMAALSQMSNDSDQNTSSAFSYLETMSSFDFVITIYACQSILPHLTPLSDHMQDPHCDLVIASARAESCSPMEKNKVTQHGLTSGMQLHIWLENGIFQSPSPALQAVRFINPTHLH